MLLRCTKSRHNAALPILTETFSVHTAAAELLPSMSYASIPFPITSSLFKLFCPLANPPSTTRQAGTLRTLGAAKVFISFCVINVTPLIKPTPKLFFRFVSSSSSFSSCSSSSASPFRLQSSCLDITPADSATRGAPSVRGLQTYSIQTLCGFCHNELHSCGRGQYSERRGSNVANYHRGQIIESGGGGAPDWSSTPLFRRI